MNLARLIERNLAQRRLSSLLTALSVSLGVMLVVAMLVMKKEMNDAFMRPGSGYHFVVGPPKGSKLTLVLNSIFHLETSPGLVPFSVLKEVEDFKYTRHTVPYAVGDAFRGYRVVGTTDAIFSRHFPHPEGEGQEKLASGKPFDYDPRALALALSRLTGDPPPVTEDPIPEVNQAVIGSEVARQLGIRVGDRIEPTHGVEGAGTAHAAADLWTVTGILKRTRTPVDRVVFINMDSFYRIPDHAGGLLKKPDGSGMEGTLSAILVFPTPGVGKALLHGRYRNRNDLSIAEVTTELRKLFEIVGGATKVFFYMSVLVVVIGVVSVMVAIYNTMNERRREIAILRSIGARRSTVLATIVGEATALALAGGLFGLLLAHGLVWGLAPILEEKAGFRPDPSHVMGEEALVLAGVTILGALAGLIPAWKAYRTDVATHLAPLS